jgi:hypothetical protein
LLEQIQAQEQAHTPCQAQCQRKLLLQVLLLLLRRLGSQSRISNHRRTTVTRAHRHSRDML